MHKLSFAGAEYGYDTDRGRCLVAFTAHDCCLKHGAHALQYTPRGLTLVSQMGFKMSMISAAVISFTGRLPDGTEHVGVHGHARPLGCVLVVGKLLLLDLEVAVEGISK